jgi:hypothetical protein
MPIDFSRNYALSTALDPRFKTHPFKNKQYLLDSMAHWVHTVTPSPAVIEPGVPDSIRSNTVDSDSLLVSYADEPPIIMAAGLEQVRFECFLLKREPQEIIGYMGAPTQSIESDPLKWWAANAHLYPHLAKAAAVVLSAPPGSVASEQVFSTVADVYSRPKRNRLSLSNTQKLIFLHKCLPIVEYSYDLISVSPSESNSEIDSDDSD